MVAMERVQSRFTRMLPELVDFSYGERLDMLDVYSGAKETEG